MEEELESLPFIMLVQSPDIVHTSSPETFTFQALTPPVLNLVRMVESHPVHDSIASCNETKRFRIKS